MILDLRAPVDIASIVFFRIAFGLVMVWEVIRYFDKGWIARYYIDPTFHFTYEGFAWVQPWGGDGMYIHFLLLGLLALFIAVGYFYRASAILFFLGFSYVFLLDKARYLNHFYLIVLVSFVMIFIPAARAFSLDARRKPETRSETAPAWALWFLRAQIGIAYFFGGVAKINGDWLRGEPMRMWLADRTDFPVIGSLFTQEWMVYFFSYGGLLLDLLVVPLLLWRKTRIYAFLAAFTFHLFNSMLFTIGIFPWFMLAATLLFFDPSWPRDVVQWIRGRNGATSRNTGALETLPATEDRRGLSLPMALAGVYLVLQFAIPMRHLLYPGNVNWTEEGHRFSWHMKLRSKDASGRFDAYDPATGQSWRVHPRDYLSRIQIDEMMTRPDMIRQFARHVADVAMEKQGRRIQVRARIMASLNGREEKLLVDPNVDLAAVEGSLLHESWILPLE